MLCEAAPHLRQSLKERFQDNEKIAVLSPDEAAALPDGSADLIVMHSVAQYLTKDEAHDLFVLFRRLVARTARSCSAMWSSRTSRRSPMPPRFWVLPPRTDFSSRPCSGSCARMLSGYWKLRQQAGLTRYSEDEIVAALKAAGFSAERAAHNLGHNQARMTFVAKPA